jgi:hypothetical protein
MSSLRFGRKRGTSLAFMMLSNPLRMIKTETCRSCENFLCKMYNLILVYIFILLRE